MNPYALVLAYFKLVTQNTTPRDLCELKGVKVYRESWKRRLFFDHVPDNFRP